MELVKSQDFWNCSNTDDNIHLTFMLIIGLRRSTRLWGLCWELHSWCHQNLCETWHLDDDKFVVYFLRQTALCLLVKVGHDASVEDSKSGWVGPGKSQNLETGNLSLGIKMFLKEKSTRSRVTQVCVWALTRPVSMLVDWVCHFPFCASVSLFVRWKL